MAEIKCPHCGEVFQVDENDYAQIVRQVRDSEFTQELHERLEAQRLQYEAQTETERLKISGELERASLEQQNKIAQLEQALVVQQQQAQAEKTLAIEKATSERERRITELEAQLSHQTEAHQAQLALVAQEKEKAEALHAQELTQTLSYKDERIRELSDELERIREQKSRLNTKLLGESLEQHCEIEFNRIRTTAFPQAIFKKDTQAVRDGEDDRPTKGDYIFRELDDEGNEVVSIMFEMKTEQEDATHHKTNESHLKKLDSDRTKKNCEYAVLVSTLEPENELYNDGIVDVSYLYDKMYVVRPQFFIPIISLLRNAGKSSLRYKAELAEVRRQDLDVAHFEAAMDEFKTGFNKNVQTASKKFSAAIDEIDKTIDHLQKVKENLVSSSRQLRYANDKADALSIRKLTRDAPSVRARLEEAHQAISTENCPPEEGTEPDKVET